jgi:hypothetical protein
MIRLKQISIHTFCMTLLITIGFSCQKDSDFGDINDNNDWKLNVGFTDREKQLFDTIDCYKNTFI